MANLKNHFLPCLFSSLLVLFLSACFLNTNKQSEVQRSEAHNGSEQKVILIHGLGRSEASLLAMQFALEREGFTVSNWGYSSICCTIEEIGQEFADYLADFQEEDFSEIHFVGHSMGNILVQWAMTHRDLDLTGRFVMLAPPNQGSESADRYTDWFEWLLPPLPDLQSQNSLATELSGIKDYEVGIIAGRFDGKVTPEEAQGIGEKDYREVNAAHTFIMNRPDVHNLTVYFLRNGTFPPKE